jgi:hypothetical protein
MTEKERKEALNEKITKLPCLVDLVQMMEEQIKCIRSININEPPSLEKVENIDKKFRNIFDLKEQSGYNQLWKEADHNELTWLKRRNLLSEQEKLFLRVDELFDIILDNLQLKLGALTVLKQLKAFNN